MVSALSGSSWMADIESWVRVPVCAPNNPLMFNDLAGFLLLGRQISLISVPNKCLIGAQ